MCGSLLLGAIMSDLTLVTAKNSAAFTNALGVQIHMNYNSAWGKPNVPYADTSTVEAALAYLNPDGIGTGVGTIRDTAYSNELSQLETLGSAGYKLDLYVSYDSSHTSYSSEYAEIQTLVKAGDVRVVEGGLEVDGFGLVSGDTYTALNGKSYTGWQAAVAMQQDVYNQFHTEVPVALFSLANPSDGSATSAAVQAASQLGTSLSAIANYGNVHYYQHNGDAPAAPSGGELAGTVHAETGYTSGLPYMITETGFDDLNQSGTNYYGTPSVNAKYTLDLVLDAFKAGSSLTSIYELFDENYGYTGHSAFEDHWGLFNADGTPKQSGVALHNMLTVLSDNGANALTFKPGSLSYGISGLPASGNSLLLEKANGVFDLVLWNDANIDTNGTLTTAAAQSVSVALGNVASVQVFDPMQNAAAEAGRSDFAVSTPALQAIASYQNATSLQVSLTDHPIILQITPSITPTPTPVPTPTPTPSPDNTILHAGSSGVIVDGSGNTWTITSQDMVYENGDPAGYTNNVTDLAYEKGAVWQENGAGLWWQWSNNSWGPSGGTSTSPVPSTITADTISLLLSGDAYKGSPQFVLLMDGKQIAGPTSVTASHSAGQDQNFTFSGHFGVGDHTLGIDFVNDLYAGTKTTDRNLYIEQVSYNGASVLSQPTTLDSNGVYNTTVHN